MKTTFALFVAITLVAACDNGSDSGPDLATCEEETDKLTECDPTGEVLYPSATACEEALQAGDEVERCVLSCDIDLSCSDYLSCVEACLP